MMKVNLYTYHTLKIHEILSRLCSRILHPDKHILVWHEKLRYLEDLSAKLWSCGPFIPHGLSTQVHSVRQPVLLTTDIDNPNRAECLIIIDNQRYDPHPWQQQILSWHIICEIFSANQNHNILISRKQCYQNLLGNIQNSTINSYVQNTGRNTWDMTKLV